MKKIISILFISISVLSCRKDGFVHPDYLIFGSIQGDCSNGCRFVYHLDNTGLTEDTTVKYFSEKDQSLFKKEISNDKFLLAKDLINKIPVSLTKTNRTIFIDLNASSPSLWYAEIKSDGRVYSWTFDNSISGTPSYLKPFAEEIIKTIELIR